MSQILVPLSRVIFLVVIGCFLFQSIIFYIYLVVYSPCRENRETTLEASNFNIRDLKLELWKDKYDGSCTCKKEERRDAIFGNYSKEHLRELNNRWFSVCQAKSAWNFISSGLVVEPLKSVRLAGLSLNYGNNEQKLTLNLDFRVTLNQGELYIANTREIGVETYGNETHHLQMNGELSLRKWNNIFDKIHFRSSTYEINGRDVISIEETNLLHTKIALELKIQVAELLPADESVKGRPIAELVTVITKTFERYDAINRLVKSINKFYPKVTIIVADDSESPERIVGKNVKHYIMPFAEGWFAGRNLALSQVKTKYFYWVDDDFIFTKETKLEILVELMEKIHPRPDIIYGYTVKSNFQFKFHTSYTRNGKVCIKRSNRQFYQVEGFPQCIWADVVLNLFIGRTLTVRQVGFDPFYQRIAHPEFFLDAYGKLRVAACQGISIEHIHIKNNKFNKYRWRKVDPLDKSRCAAHMYGKFSNFACMK